MRILLVEDDAMIGKTLLAGAAAGRLCRRLGHRRRRPAKLALDTAGEGYALVLLDLGLPRKSGLDLLKEIRRAGNKARVLIVTARDAVADRVAGFDAGADDYLTKPFSLDELQARMRALLRRDIARETHLLRHRDLALDTVDAHRVPRRTAGRPVRARVRAARGAARTTGGGAFQSAARGAHLQLGRRSREQRRRGARAPSAPQARRRHDPHDPRRRATDRSDMTSIRRTLIVRLMAGVLAIALLRQRGHVFTARRRSASCWTCS